MVGAVVDTADEGPLTIDHHDLAVQTAKQVGAHTQQAGLWIERMKADTRVGHR
ncbi:hypothetical protein D9M71_815200 [compost metagenome]